MSIGFNNVILTINDARQVETFSPFANYRL